MILILKNSPKKRDKSYKLTWKTKKFAHSVLADSLWTHRRYSPRNSPGQNTAEGSYSLHQRIFPTQGWNSVSHIAGRVFTSWAMMEAPWITESLWWRQWTAQAVPSPGHASLLSGGWNPGTFGWLNPLPLFHREEKAFIFKSMYCFSPLLDIKIIYFGFQFQLLVANTINIFFFGEMEQ